VPTRATGTGPLDRPLPVPLLYVGAGVILAIVTLAIDRSLGDAVPGWLRVGHQTALSLVAGFGSGLLFVVSVVFMVRIYAVQMSAEPFSARVLRHFLADLADTIGADHLGAVAAAVGAVRDAVPGHRARSAPAQHLRLGCGQRAHRRPAGERRLDAALAGLGGCPFTPGISGTWPPTTWCTYCTARAHAPGSTGSGSPPPAASSPCWSATGSTRRSRPSAWPRPSWRA
jgi:hypothetical protein